MRFRASPWRRRRLIALLAALVAGGLTVPAGADTPSVPSAANPAEQPKASLRTITLLTGDKVVVATRPGSPPQAMFRAAEGREHVGVFRSYTKDGRGRLRLNVVPADAADLLASGRLDPRLFDVTGQADTLPSGTVRPARVIAAYRGAPPASLRGTDGIRTVRALPAVDGAALRAAPDEPSALWSALTTGGAVKRLRPGVERVWLDGRVRVKDERSNGQIGASAAWESGYTGKGVDIAVLDTGLDATHPDFAGRIKESRDFSDSGGTKDTVGHGTHVASIALGSGAGGPGAAYRGVAPDASLLVGKVCGDEYCDDSAIIAGMEWAAQRGADIVNLSLGTEDASDGQDPLSLALNDLTDRYGTLFVAAAGNSYCWEPTISGPAAADEALAVGAVDAHDVMSVYSSCGPRPGDHAVKPDLAAPGDDIAAARAAGTSIGEPVDELYTRLSGTSMATPHVAGAAALLAQRHPDWSGRQLKAALVSSTDPAAAQPVFGTGSGRLDAARATWQQVYAETGALSFGRLAYPQQNLPDVRRTVRYRNTGATDVTLTLASSLSKEGDNGPAPDGSLTLSADRITVPAHGTAEVTATLKASGFHNREWGQFGGRVTATGEGLRVVTAVGVVVEPESYDVKIKAIDRDGKPTNDDLVQYVSAVQHNAIAYTNPYIQLRDGEATVRLPKGHYAFTGALSTPDPELPAREAPLTLEAQFRTPVDHDGITVTLDARRGKKVVDRVGRPDARRYYTELDLSILSDNDESLFGLALGAVTRAPMYAVPRAADPERVAMGHTAVMLPAKGAAYTYYLAHAPRGGGIPQNLDYPVRDAELGKVRADYRAQGKPATGARSAGALYMPLQALIFGILHDVPLPGSRTEFYSPGTEDSGARWSEHLFQRAADTPLMGSDGAISGIGIYAPGSSTPRVWNQGVLRPDLDTHRYANGVYRTGDTLAAIVGAFAPTEPGHGAAAVFQLPYVKADMTLTRDGKVLGEAPLPGIGWFAMPEDPGTYELTLDAQRSPDWATTATRLTTEWTFRSERPLGLDWQPLLQAGVTSDFDKLGRGRSFDWQILDVTVAAQAGAPEAKLKDLSVEVSFDDGATWTHAWIQERKVNKAKVAVFNPSDRSAFASLRVSASDTQGNKLRQTVIRAYGLA
ncbi:S8 family serine peptidase [Streptomyces luteolifulvus]|uniref:S8 family serine peptidase n=1 Tax=Streptomyces luteolifulvus TaxID=2615112 RepID=A0A6H9UTI9_9ACTN|nr:S8 family serine peptidase [Streptomyces luteolifulvus]KAB1141279.1 S8 family serine peptidase [Streptomyces luteolifulvus]